MAIEFTRGESLPHNPGRPLPAAGRLRWQLRRIGTQERMLYTERLALLLETGVSLVEALRAMQAQSEDQRITAILRSLADTLSDGKSFSAALSQHPEMFPRIYANLVAAAEEGGFLPEVLQQLHDMDEKRSQMRAAIVSALSYPAFLACFSIAVVIFVLVVIFPRFHDLFASIHNDLPMPTLVLMALSDFLRHYWLPVLLLTIAGTWALVSWCRTPAGVQLIDRLKTRTPLLKDVFLHIYLSETLGAVGMSLANGVPITVALKAAREIVGSTVFGAFLDDVGRQVNEGKGIAAGFADSELVSPMVRQMIATAEQTGNLAKVMTRVGDYYERELQKRITLFAKAIEPLMLVIMGAVVGLVVSALILPIFELSRAVH